MGTDGTSEHQVAAETNDEARIVDHREEERYELWLGDELAGVIEYELQDGAIVLIHTEVDPSFEGRGLGSKLIRAALDDIAARGLRLIPECQFVLAFLRRHREYLDLLGPRAARS
jgi:uncharacterized protein